MRVQAVRGAICVDEDRAEVLLAATQRLVAETTARNGIPPEELVSILFTATEDLRSAFPAEAARRMGLGHVPLLCAREIPVERSMPRVVRLLAHFHTERTPAQIEHVYLDGAESLRDDLG